MLLAVAAYELERAHRAAGQLYAAVKLEDFGLALRELVIAGHSMIWWIARVGLDRAPDDVVPEEREPRAEFDRWLDTAIEVVASHPLHAHRQLTAFAGAPDRAAIAIDLDRAELAVSGSLADQPVNAAGLRLDIDGSAPAIQLCAEYLERLTALYDSAKRLARQLDLDRGTS